MEKAYSRPEALIYAPTGYCPGCLHGVAVKLVAEIIDELKIREKTICVLPVGCSTLGLMHWNMDMISSPHGRAPAVATGIKRCSPENVVFSYQGDGDLAAIGLSEIMHSANRGENITVIFVNNSIYGMTGGQMAPTTLIGQKSTTGVKGRDAETAGYPMKMCEIISQLQAPRFVARYALNTPQNIMQARKGIKKGFELQVAKKGFSFIELLSNCPTNWGMSPEATLNYMKQNTMVEFELDVFRDMEAGETNGK